MARQPSRRLGLSGNPFGQTPYSPVNVVGMIEGDQEGLAKGLEGDAVAIHLAEKPS
jgi:hypothetical protein